MSQRHAPDACRSPRSQIIQAELASCLGAKCRSGRAAQLADSSQHGSEFSSSAREQVVCVVCHRVARSRKRAYDAGPAVLCQILHAAPVAGDACAVTSRCLHARNLLYFCRRLVVLWTYILGGVTSPIRTPASACAAAHVACLHLSICRSVFSVRAACKGADIVCLQSRRRLVL